MDSILNSIKKLLGIQEDYEEFDTDLIIDINSALLSVNQLGVGPKEGFQIEDSAATWGDLIGSRTDLAAVKTYVYLKVRLMFDPPQHAYLINSIESQCKEYEFRINVQQETP